MKVSHIFAINESHIRADLPRRRIREGNHLGLVLWPRQYPPCRSTALPAPPFVPQCRHNAYELAQFLGGYHDAGVQTLGASKAVFLIVSVDTDAVRTPDRDAFFPQICLRDR